MARYTASTIQAALARLTGVSGKQRNHVVTFRVTVTSSDGKKCSVNVRVSPKGFYDSNLGQIADELRVTKADVENVLENWTPEQLTQHLSAFPSSVLDSPAALRTFQESPPPIE